MVLRTIITDKHKFRIVLRAKAGIGTKIFAIAAFCVFAPWEAYSQSPPAPAFDVASVRPSDGSVGTNMRTYPDRLLATDFTLGKLIQVAFSLESWQLEGGPAWLNRDKFNIEAKAGELTGPNAANTVTTGGGVAPQKMMLMLQALLAERFNLTVRRETRQVNVYSLLKANDSSGLQKPRDTSASFIGTNRIGPPPAVVIQGHKTLPLMEQLAHYLSGADGAAGNGSDPIHREVRFSGGVCPGGFARWRCP